jgi:hypothetical protein
MSEASLWRAAQLKKLAPTLDMLLRLPQFEQNEQRLLYSIGGGHTNDAATTLTLFNQWAVRGLFDAAWN